MKNKFRSGYIAIVGRPNVGKSTLLNHVLGQKLCITSEKPQTTRHSILGVKTTEDFQAIYVDTPGLHKESHNLLNRYMNRAATGVMFDVDVVVFMVEAMQWTEDDEWAFQKLSGVTSPVVLVVNKVDKVPDKSALLPYLQTLSEKRTFANIFPISARKENDVKLLEDALVALLPKGEEIFPPDQLTDRNERFFAAEIVREKLMRQLGQELPYATAVEIEQFKEEKGMLRISAVIYVDKPGQKNIVIGEKGDRLKKIGTQARLDMEKLFQERVFLQLWVKVKKGWADDEKGLKGLGYF